jgi:molybdopterin molybdotransferase
MKPFFQVKTPREILQLIRSLPRLPLEKVPLEEGLGRVLGEDVLSPEDLPHFPRAAMDGFAVRARDTFGASEAVPALLTLKGEILMGQNPPEELSPGACFKISTGGMLPSGADAVVMLEHTQTLSDGTVEIFKPVSPLDHVIERGEDVQKGRRVLSAGQKLRPQDLGLLAALGIKEITVSRRPKTAILSTGDEIVGLEENPPPGFVRDVNSVTLKSLALQGGALPFFLGRTKDDFPALKSLCQQGLKEAEVILVSGGSSVGTRDLTLEVIRSFPEAKVLAHGIAVSPGKPTILARIGDKVLWGLPGHVVSAMIVFSLFVRPCLDHLQGMDVDRPFPKVKAFLSRNVASAPGREEYVRVFLQPAEKGWEAVPLLGKSGLISTMVRADGLIRIDQHCEGLEKGEEVEVWLFPEGPSPGV